MILRPHAVYGPGDTTLLPRFEALVRGPVLPMPAGLRSWHTLTRVESLAEAVLLALRARAEPGIYNIADARAVRLDLLLCEVLARRGRRVRILPVPVGPVAAAAQAAQRLQRIRPGVRVPVTPYALELLTLDCVLDTRRAQRAFGFRPGRSDVSDAQDWGGELRETTP